MNKKNCSKCHKSKLESDFYKNKSAKDGLQAYCINCFKPILFKNSERYRKDKKNKKTIYNTKRKFFLNNKEKVNQWRRNWANKNWKHVQEKRREPKRLISDRISASIRNSLGGSKNNRKWEDIVGYDFNELKTNIISKFKNNMSWDKVLSGNIEIDHILPIEIFNFKSFEDTQFKICWSLNNLQPLWKYENVKKSDYLFNGLRARDLSPQKKKEYLKSLGYNI